MKLIPLLIVALLLPMTALAHEATDTLTVLGNCRMCEKRIEKAVKKVEGVAEAEWNRTTKKLVVTYDVHTTTITDIRAAVLGAGHDLEDEKASDSVYVKLPDCCRFREKDHTH